MDNIVVRTDLAVEANEEAMNGTGKLRGIRLRESNKSRMGVKVTELQVTNHLGEAAIGRPKGTYLTIEADDIAGGDEEYAKEVISTLAGYIFKLLKRMNKNVKPEKILVIGLGNRNITSDSLGPEVVDNICIKISEGEETGVCTLSTIQRSDQGINPGSGVGNHRIGITKDNIGVPVLAIGVPTVIDAEGIIQGAGKMYVTPKDIDSDIRNISIIISKAINRVGVHIHG